jgi:GNAT superfamily N-acetyltransferase
MAYRFDLNYSETIQLKDGVTVTARLLRPEDREALSSGLSELSRQSNYQRFFTVKPRLSERELNYLTNIDQRDHFAMTAVVNRDNEGNKIPEKGIAIARFIKLEEDPVGAEFSLVVIDAYQGLGLGYQLCLRLIQAALERGVKRFYGEMLASNDTMIHLLSRIGRIMKKQSNGNRINFILPLDPHSEE